MFGPVFRFEAIRTARQGRFYVARVLFGLALLIYLLSEASNWDTYSLGFAPGKVARFAATAFGRFAWAQFLAIAAIVPALVAGVIGREEQKRTLADLLASPLSCTAILADKVLGRLLHVGVGLLLGPPVVALLAAVGGVEPEVLAALYGMLAAVVLFLSGLAALISVLLPRPGLANLLAYVFVLVWLAAPVLLISISGAGMLSRYRAAIEAILFHHPIGLLIVHGSLTQTRLLNPSAPVGMPGWSPFGIVGRSLLIHGGIGLGAFGLAILVLKARRGGRFARRRTPRFLASAGRPPVGDDPMLWKERHAPSGGGPPPRAVQILGLGLVAGVIAYIYEPLKMSILQGQTLESLVDSIRAGFAFVDLMALILVAGAAALAIVGERERETWTSLRTTLLTGREIVRAKQFGAIWGMRWILAGMATLWVVGLAMGTVSWVGVLASGLGAAVFAWYAVALGVAVSLRANDSGRAIGATALLLLATTIGYLVPALAIWNQVVLRTMAPNDAPWLLFGVTPYLEWAALLAPGELGLMRSRTTWPIGGTPLFSYRGPQVIASFGLGLALHALAAWGMTRWSIRALDARPVVARQPAGTATPPERWAAAAPALSP